MRRPLARYDGSFRWTALVVALFVARSISAQTECAQRFDDAKALFDNGDRQACISTIGSALGNCDKDRDLKGRLLFLKALAEAGEDSLDLMRADLERLFRNDRHYVIKAYDPLMKGKPGEADLYGAWEDLQYDLLKDHGCLRVGASVSMMGTVPRVLSDNTVHWEDEDFTYKGKIGAGIALSAEWDLLHNIAVTGSAGYSSLGYTTTNQATTYQERLTLLPFTLGVKKMFWTGRKRLVPTLAIKAGTTWIQSADAEVAREVGNDTRYLDALSLDRLAERRQRQYSLELLVGMAHKVGSTSLCFEVGYQRSLTSLLLDTGPYTNTELMTGYYYADNDIHLDAILVRITAHYILAFHRKNRFHY